MLARLFIGSTLAPSLAIELPDGVLPRVISWGTKSFSSREFPPEPPSGNYYEAIVLACNPADYWTAPAGLPGEPTEVLDIDWDNF